MEWLGIILFIAGFVLIGIEMVVPGFGLPGISGLGCLVAAVLLTADSVEQGLMMTVVIIVLAALMLTVIMVFLNSRKIKPPIVLDQELRAEEAMLDSEDMNYLIGKEGVAATDLKPAGKCSFDGIQFDVRSDGSYVEKGTKVRISSIHENTIIVQQLAETLDARKVR